MFSLLNTCFIFAGVVTRITAPDSPPIDVVGDDLVNGKIVRS